MIVFVGGLAGSGRRFVARAYAEKLGLHLYPMQQRKLRSFVRSADGVMRERIIPPSSDAERLRIYRLVADDLRLIAKMYPGVVVCDSFHRAGPREYLLAEARKYFDSVVFVWMQSDDDHMRARMSKRAGASEGSMTRKLHAKARQAQECEAPPRGTALVEHRESLDEALEQLSAAVSHAQVLK